MDNILSLTASEAVNEIKKRNLTAYELTQKYIENIKLHDETINAYISLTAQEAIMRAKTVDERMKAGDYTLNLALCGIPFSVKDNMNVSGVRTTCASKMLEQYIPPYTATAVSRALDKGGIMLGKVNMDEFAMGSSCEKSIYGATLNPIDNEYSTGGSSGGSAASVAGLEALFSLGSDTGGSARQPASFCGLVSMKPTYGLVSRYGLVEFASSMDQICPITRDVHDNALVLSAICGKDVNDMTSLNINNGTVFLSDETKIKGLKIGIVNGVRELCDETVTHCYERTVKILTSLGCEMEEISLPSPELALEIYHVSSASEASSNLARYDGIKYSYGSDSFDSTTSRTAGFGEEVKKRIITGTYALQSSALNNNYYKVLLARRELAKQVDEIFEKYDMIAMPTTISTAFKRGSFENDSSKLYYSDEYTVYANLTGCPAITIPNGGNGKMPSGFMLMGRKLSEGLLYNTAYVLESELREYNRKETLCFTMDMKP